MYSLTLEITKRCNLNCSYCYVENKEKVNMKWKTAQLAIDIAMREAIKQKDKTLSVYFIGGECKLCLNGMPVPLLRNCYSIFNGTKYR